MDSQEILDGLTTFFLEEDYEVTGLTTSDEALNSFYQAQPKLVFLDMILPELSWFEICGRVREIPDAPIIIYGALRSEPEKVQTFEQGADDYIV